MLRFDYSAKDGLGKEYTGVIEAETKELAIDTLRDRGLIVESVEESAKAGTLAFEIPFFNKIPIRDLVVFSRQFSVLMGAKVPVVTALKTVSRQTQNARFKKIVTEIAADVESGTPLSLAMSAYPKAFSDFFVNMIRSGETTGRLEEVMNYLADQMERDFDLMSKIKGAMIYPIFIVFGLVVVGFIMMVFVVPKLTSVLKESGAKLPWTTQTLIAVSSFFQHYAIQIAIAAVLAVIGLQYWIRTPRGRIIWDSAILWLPVFGPLLQRIYLVRFTRSFGTMLAGGVDVPGSLQICADIVGNAYYRDLILETRKEVLDGNSVTTVFIRSRRIPTMIPQMIGVGEETGRLQEVLERLTQFYSRELQNLVSNLVSAIEPLIMLVMGGAVGVMVSAIILPMYSLATSF
jgi:type II secretory pathway component PulF